MTRDVFSLTHYYMDKYGPQVISKLERDADFCAQQNDLGRRNRLLRIRDMILLDDTNIPENQDPA